MSQVGKAGDKGHRVRKVNNNSKGREVGKALLLSTVVWDFRIRHLLKWMAEWMAVRVRVRQLQMVVRKPAH